ncbi:unnamed protein product [Nippostrongylus brasiliensis]|uniref:Transcription initiation factor TFIID subunit 8 n=1 Tax=Nippostrongylus brasiliensis TaxID=27835 RepID=A0A0N4YDV2_NIPBR|nr:unnamed protein product [Nippostrongylus brasiliensis]
MFQNKLDTPCSEINEEVDAYANLLEDDTIGASPTAPVRPVPLGIEARADGEIPPEIWPEEDPNEQVLRQSVAAIASSVGFDAIDANALACLAQRMKNYICSISMASKLHCEVAGRTTPIAADVWLALADIGHKLEQLPEYIRHLRVTGTIAIAPPRERQEPPLLPPMLVGQSRPHPPYVHEFLPPFPEPHTYIHTEISGEPDLTYEAVRKTAAQRRREMERSLINYMIRMHNHTTLFPQFESKIRNEAKQHLRDIEREAVFRKQKKKAIKAGIIDERHRIGSGSSEDIEKKEGSDRIPGRSKGSTSGDGDENDGPAQMYDNPYIRIALVQRKELKFLRESLELTP